MLQEISTLKDAKELSNLISSITTSLQSMKSQIEVYFGYKDGIKVGIQIAQKNQPQRNTTKLRRSQSSTGQTFFAQTESSRAIQEEVTTNRCNVLLVSSG